MHAQRATEPEIRRTDGRAAGAIEGCDLPARRRSRDETPAAGDGVENAGDPAIRRAGRRSENPAEIIQAAAGAGVGPKSAGKRTTNSVPGSSRVYVCVPP